MTTLDRETTIGVGSAGSGAGSRRRSLASIVLAVAILVVGGVAVGVLVHGSSATSAASAPAAAPPAASAPASPAPSPAAPPPADGPAVVDASGAPMPGPVADGVRSVFTALAGGDVNAVQPAYVPSRTVKAAPWATVAGLLQNPANRTAVLGALRTAPVHTPDGYRYATPDGNQVGVDPQGHISYLRIA